MIDRLLNRFPAPTGVERPENGKRTLIMCDFDGTACSVDMGSKLLDRFAGDGWRAIDRAYCTEKIGSRTAYTEVASLFRGTREQMVEYVQSEANIAAYFADFYRFCRARGYGLVIVSDGLDFYIEAILKKHGLGDIAFFSNSVSRWHSDGISIEFPYGNDICGKCGTCKSSIVKEYHDHYDRIVYIGDSYSDVCPSRFADMVFAKHILFEKCRRNGTACIPYENFRDVINHLSTSCNFGF